MHGWPHEMPHARTHGRSPGNGLTPMHLSREPIATEGEATPGSDDVNPYEEFEVQRELAALKEDPTEDPDPFVFDDVGREVERFKLPSLENEPVLRF